MWWLLNYIKQVTGRFMVVFRKALTALLRYNAELVSIFSE